MASPVPSTDPGGTDYGPQWSATDGQHHQLHPAGSSYRQHGSGFVSIPPYITPNTQHHGSHFMQPQQCYDQYGQAPGATPYAPSYASAPAAALERGALFNIDTGSWYTAPQTMASQQQEAHEDPGTVVLALQQQLALMHNEIRAVRSQLASQLAVASAATLPVPALQRSPPFGLLPSFAPAPISTITIKSLDSETVRSRRAAGGDLRPETVEKFVERFRNRMATRHQAVRYLLSLSSNEQQRYLAAPPDAALPGGTLFAGDLVVANQWIADAFLNCLDYEADRVGNFESALSTSEMSDGIALLSKALQLGEHTMGCQRIDAEQIFADCKPFKSGADVEATKKAALELLNKFKRTPLYAASFNDPIATRRMLIRKLPDSLTLTPKKDKMETDLLEAEIRHRKDPVRLAIEPWDQEQLIEFHLGD